MSGLGNKVTETIINNYLYFYFPTNGSLGYWDICAGHALAKEMGGNCLYSSGEELIYPCSYSNEDKTVKKSIVISPDNKQLLKFLKKINENRFEL